MVCCGLGKGESVGSPVWRAYVLWITLVSGTAGVVALLVVSALSGASKHCRSWSPSIRHFLIGTIGPRLLRFVDRELFVGLARWRCRLSGRLLNRSPRLGGVVYRYFNIAILMGALSATVAVLVVGLSLV